MTTIAFELVAPERLLVSRPVNMVTVPGSEGDFGVLAGHAPLVSTLRTGVIEIQEESGSAERIFVAGGFAEISPERCTVLAEEAVPVSEIDRSKVDAEIKAGREELLVAENDAERERINRRIAMAEAKLAAVA